MKVPIFKYAIVLLIIVASVVNPAHAVDEFPSARIRILEITPPSGATIDEHTVIRAKLWYEINGFRSDSDRYMATAMFDSTAPNKFVMVSKKVGDSFTGQSKIRNRTGELQINYPLSMILKRRGIAVKPIRLRFVINAEYEDDEQSRFFKNFFEKNGPPMFFKTRTIGRTATVTYVPTFSQDSQTSVEKSQKEPYEKEEVFFVVPKEPSIVIHNVAVNPKSVTAGSRFDLVVDYSVSDPSNQSDRIPVKFSFSILRSERVVFAPEPVELQALNGGKMSRIVTLTANKEQGIYELKAVLKYKGKMTSDTTQVKIK